MTSTNNNTVFVAFLPASMRKQIRTVEITPELSSMYTIIGCDLVEPVAIAPAYDATIWVDEEGMLKSAPLNIRASLIAGRPLYGDAILAGDGPNGEICALRLNCPQKFFETVDYEATKMMHALAKEPRA